MKPVAGVQLIACRLLRTSSTEFPRARGEKGVRRSASNASGWRSRNQIPATAATAKSVRKMDRQSPIGTMPYPMAGARMDRTQTAMKSANPAQNAGFRPT